MADIQITCINKLNRQSAHEAITHVGSYSQRWPREAVVNSIKRGENTFYTMVDGRRATVSVYREIYLRTHADRVWTDNLLALIECAY